MISIVECGAKCVLTESNKQWSQTNKLFSFYSLDFAFHMPHINLKGIDAMKNMKKSM